MTRRLFLIGLLLAMASPSSAQVADPAAKIYYQDDQVIRQELDSNRDGRSDVWIFFEGGRPARQEQDEDFDGRVDVWHYYRDGRLVKQEVDDTRDGKADTIFELDETGALQKKVALGSGGSRQRVITYANNLTTKQEEDTDGDGVIDRVVVFEGGKIARVEDLGLTEGRPNTFSYYDRVGSLERVEGDKNKDGLVDTRQSYVAGRLDREEADTDFDGRFDTKTWFKGDQIARREVDSDGDQQPELAVSYANGKPTREIRIGDAGHETITFESGEMARREIDTDRDGRVDVIEETSGERTTKKLEDSDRDGRFDTVTEWPDALTVVQETDSDGDGKIDLRSTFRSGKLTQQDADTNKDGRADVWISYRDGEKTLQEEDTDFDGRIDARFTYTGGEVAEQKRVSRKKPSPDRAAPFAVLPTPPRVTGAPATRSRPERPGLTKDNA